MKQPLAVFGSDGTVGGPGGTPLSTSVLTYTHNVPSLQTVRLTPAPGTEWSYTVQANQYVRLTGGYAPFSTNSATASRYPGLYLADATGVIVGRHLPVGTAYGASITNGHHSIARTPKWVQGGMQAPGTTEDAIGMPSFVLPPFWTFGSLTAGLQTVADGGGVKDSYGTVNLLLQVWTGQPPTYSVPGPNL